MESLQKINRTLLSVAFSICASLATVQMAQANSTFYHEDEHHGGGGCHQGGEGPACGQTATKYFYDFTDDGFRDDASKKLSSGDTQNISINYSVDSGWSITSAWLRIWAKDDSNSDGSEMAKYTSIEGTPVSMAAQEIDGEDWYLLYDVTNLLNGTPFLATLKSTIGDFKYMNAELQLDMKTADCPSPVPLPAAAWLFGSALLGFVSLSNRRKV